MWNFWDVKLKLGGMNPRMPLPLYETLVIIELKDCLVQI